MEVVNPKHFTNVLEELRSEETLARAKGELERADVLAAAASKVEREQANEVMRTCASL